jgi:hypothetical protein
MGLLKVSTAIHCLKIAFNRHVSSGWPPHACADARQFFITGTWLAATRYHPFVAGTCDWPRISHDALPNPFLALVVPEGLLGYERPDRMHIGLDPDVVQFDCNVNGLADPRTVERVGMGVNLGPGDLPAYGQVLKV